jgi:hypothetical protein
MQGWTTCQSGVAPHREEGAAVCVQPREVGRVHGRKAKNSDKTSPPRALAQPTKRSFRLYLSFSQISFKFIIYIIKWIFYLCFNLKSWGRSWGHDSKCQRSHYFGALIGRLLTTGDTLTIKWKRKGEIESLIEKGGETWVRRFGSKVLYFEHSKNAFQKFQKINKKVCTYREWYIIQVCKVPIQNTIQLYTKKL